MRISWQRKDDVSRQQGVRRRASGSKGAKKEWRKKINSRISDAKREKVGSLCHSGFELAAQFDEGKKGKKAEACEANNTLVQR